MDEFTAHRSRRQLPQRVSLIVFTGVHGNLLDFLDGHVTRSPQTLDDDLTTHALLHVLFDLLQNLACQHDDRRCSVSDFRIL